jgi:hypothetical protein
MASTTHALIMAIGLAAACSMVSLFSVSMGSTLAAVQAQKKNNNKDPSGGDPAKKPTQTPHRSKTPGAPTETPKPTQPGDEKREVQERALTPVNASTAVLYGVGEGGGGGQAFEHVCPAGTFMNRFNIYHDASGITGLEMQCTLNAKNTTSSSSMLRSYGNVKPTNGTKEEWNGAFPMDQITGTYDSEGIKSIEGKRWKESQLKAAVASANSVSFDIKCERGGVMGFKGRMGQNHLLSLGVVCGEYKVAGSYKNPLILKQIVNPPGVAVSEVGASDGSKGTAFSFVCDEDFYVRRLFLTYADTTQSKVAGIRAVCSNNMASEYFGKMTDNEVIVGKGNGGFDAATVKPSDASSHVHSVAIDSASPPPQGNAVKFECKDGLVMGIQGRASEADATVYRLGLVCGKYQ